MILPQSLEEIIRLTAKENQVPEELVKQIHLDLWAAVREYITNPHTSKKGVLLNEAFKFELKENKLKKILEHSTDEEKIEYYENLLKQIQK